MKTSLQFAYGLPKDFVFDEVRKFIEREGFEITNSDESRPWGGFFYVAEEQSAKFISAFFPHLSLEDFRTFTKLSPKVLLVAPGKRLSWQYHHRRAEIWKLIGGKATLVVSDTDELKPERNLDLGEVVSLKQGERHRLVGTTEWGIVAEIWQHTYPENPSDEDDIIRVEDDFGR